MLRILSIFQKTTPELWLQVSFILLLTAIAGLLIRRILNKFRQIHSLPEWLKSLCDSFYLPSAWMIWGYGIFLAIEVIAAATDLFVSLDLLSKVRNILLIIFATWIILGWKDRFEKSLKKKISQRPSQAQDEILIMAISRVLTIFILTISGLILLDTMGFELTAIFAFGGIGGVAIGFAGKDIVANFFGGFMIHINRHFTIGEWIMSPNKNFEGIVEEIGWYMTRLRTFARRPTYIPNALFIDAIIENPGRMYNRRIKEMIGLRYQDAQKVEPIVKAIRKMLLEHPAIDKNKTLLVHLLAFGPSSLNIEVYCFTKTTSWEKWRDEQQNIFLKIIEIVHAHGAEIAFPTQTVHLEQDSSRDFKQMDSEVALLHD